MGYLKKVALYISILVLIVMVAGCGKSDETKEDSKEEQIKKSFAKTLDMYQSKILKIYTTKKDIEMANLKKAIRGHGLSVQQWLNSQKVKL